LSTLGVWAAKPGRRGRPHAPGRGPKQQTPGAMAGRGHNMAAAPGRLIICYNNIYNTNNYINKPYVKNTNNIY